MAEDGCAPKIGDTVFEPEEITQCLVDLIGFVENMVKELKTHGIDSDLLNTDQPSGDTLVLKGLAEDIKGIDPDFLSKVANIYALHAINPFQKSNNLMTTMIIAK